MIMPSSYTNRCMHGKRILVSCMTLGGNQSEDWPTESGLAGHLGVESRLKRMSMTLALREVQAYWDRVRNTVHYVIISATFEYLWRNVWKPVG